MSQTDVTYVNSVNNMTEAHQLLDSFWTRSMEDIRNLNSVSVAIVFYATRYAMMFFPF